MIFNYHKKIQIVLLNYAIKGLVEQIPPLLFKLSLLDMHINIFNNLKMLKLFKIIFS